MHISQTGGAIDGRSESATAGRAVPNRRAAVARIDERTRALWRRVHSGRALTLAEYVQAEEALATAPPIQVRASTSGRRLVLKVQFAPESAGSAPAARVVCKPAIFVQP
jgi:hypothetical protein